MNKHNTWALVRIPGPEVKPDAREGVAGGTSLWGVSTRHGSAGGKQVRIQIQGHRSPETSNHLVQGRCSGPKHQCRLQGEGIETLYRPQIIKILCIGHYFSAHCARWRSLLTDNRWNNDRRYGHSSTFCQLALSFDLSTNADLEGEFSKEVTILCYFLRPNSNHKFFLRSSL